jgi:hypothetical protein
LPRPDQDSRHPVISQVIEFLAAPLGGAGVRAERRRLDRDLLMQLAQAVFVSHRQRGESHIIGIKRVVRIPQQP